PAQLFWSAALQAPPLRPEPFPASGPVADPPATSQQSPLDSANSTNEVEMMILAEQRQLVLPAQRRNPDVVGRYRLTGFSKLIFPGGGKTPFSLRGSRDS